jgi:flagellar biosynthesis regulator FlbT
MSGIASNDKICARFNRTLHYFVVAGVSADLKRLSGHHHRMRIFKASQGIRRLGQVQSQLSSSKDFPAFPKKWFGAEASETPRYGQLENYCSCTF